jgi:hypothetical protein
VLLAVSVMKRKFLKTISFTTPLKSKNLFSHKNNEGKRIVHKLKNNAESKENTNKWKNIPCL